jgi:hypothetical protein
MYEVFESDLLPGFWVARCRGDTVDVALFFGPHAEARCRTFAAFMDSRWPNGEERDADNEFRRVSLRLRLPDPA